MNAMGRFERSWRLFKSSILIVIHNKQLLLFPVVTAALTVVMTLFFLAPAALWPTGHSYMSTAHWDAILRTWFRSAGDASAQHGQVAFSPLAIAYLAFLYFVSMFLATFFNVGFYSQILAALGGQPVSLAAGLKFACARWKAILMWTLFAGLVGLLIRAVERRFDLVGRIIARLIGVAWSIASVFAIPVIVHEEDCVNPFEVLRRSAGILKRTWGEGLIGYAGLAFGNALVLLGSIALVGGAAFASSALNNFWLLGIVLAAWVLGIFAWGYLMNVASLVYKGALYLYAAEGVIPPPYDQDMLNAAWKFRKS